MEYTATLSSSGQITLPKALRTHLKLNFGDKVSLRLAQNKIELKRIQDLQEVLAEIDQETTPAIRAKIAERAGQTAGEFRETWLKSPESKDYYREKNYENR